VGRLVRRTLHGDELLAEWSDSEPGSYERAADRLRRELEAGNSAARMNGPAHESVTELPPDAELVVLTTAMGGG
jgi:hypothetical protein